VLGAAFVVALDFAADFDVGMAGNVGRGRARINRPAHAAVDITAQK
jgi:hypothetical protein